MSHIKVFQDKGIVSENSLESFAIDHQSFVGIHVRGKNRKPPCHPGCALKLQMISLFLTFRAG